MEKEYEKLELYIKIYSGKSSETSYGLSEEEIRRLKQVAEMLDRGKIKIVVDSKS